MAEKAYENNSYVKKFTTKIKEIKDIDNKYHVVLDKTYFYPEGGGQPSDLGKIDGIDVEYVYKKEDKVYHVLNKKPSQDENITCKIDWDRRYDFMQQHTGQHLLSALFNKMYNLKTIGFTLSENSLRIDLDKKISHEKIKEVECKTNQYIYNNIDLEILFPENNELTNLDLRKKPTVDENIRIIKIGDLDYSPCGGTHLKSLSELGIVKIINIENYKSGLRIDFVCGKRALKDYDLKNDILNEMKNTLSVPIVEILDKINNIKEDLSESEKKLSELKDKILKFESEELLKEAINIGKYKVIKKTFKDKSFKEVQYLANILVDKKDIVCIFGQCDKSTARLLVFRSVNIDLIDANELIKTSLNLINGNGGGNKLKAQGGGNNTKGIDKAVENIFEKTNNILKV